MTHITSSFVAISTLARCWLSRVYAFALVGCVAMLPGGALATGCNSVPVTPSLASNNLWFCKAPSDVVFVFVHGIRSNSYSAWIRDEKDPKSAFWPAILAKDEMLGQHSIFLAGYRAELDSQSYGIRQIATDLRIALQDKGVLERKNIIFVAHSLGGVVVRHMLYHQREYFIDKNIGLVLYASPSLGSDVSKGWMGRLLGSSLMKQLAVNSPELYELDQNFRDLVLRSWTKQPGGLSMRGMERVEDLATFGASIVKPESASQYFGPMQSVGGTDHQTIVKPPNADHPTHMALRAFFREFSKSFLTFDHQFNDCLARGEPGCSMTTLAQAGPLVMESISDETRVSIVRGANAIEQPWIAASFLTGLKTKKFEAYIETATAYWLAGKSESARLLLNYIASMSVPSIEYSAEERYLAEAAAVALLVNSPIHFDRFVKLLSQRVKLPEKVAMDRVTLFAYALSPAPLSEPLRTRLWLQESIDEPPSESLRKSVLHDLVIRFYDMRRRTEFLARSAYGWAAIWKRRVAKDPDTMRFLPLRAYGDALNELGQSTYGRLAIPYFRAAIEQQFPATTREDLGRSESSFINALSASVVYQFSPDGLPTGSIQRPGDVLSWMERAAAELQKRGRRVHPDWLKLTSRLTENGSLDTRERARAWAKLASVSALNGDAPSAIERLEKGLLELLDVVAKECFLKTISISDPKDMAKDCGERVRLEAETAKQFVEATLPLVATAVSRIDVKFSDDLLSWALSVAADRAAPQASPETVKAEKDRLVSSPQAAIRVRSLLFFLRYYSPRLMSGAGLSANAPILAAVRLDRSHLLSDSQRTELDKQAKFSDDAKLALYHAALVRAAYTEASLLLGGQDVGLRIATDVFRNTADIERSIQIAKSLNAGRPLDEAYLCNYMVVNAAQAPLLPAAIAIFQRGSGDPSHACISPIVWRVCLELPDELPATLSRVRNANALEGFSLRCIGEQLTSASAPRRSALLGSMTSAFGKGLDSAEGFGAAAEIALGLARGL